jgi:hypothetical protein
VGWFDLTASDEVGAADWIRERLHPFAKDVGSVVPAGFAAYARIFHPATRSRDWKEEEVRWSEVAAWNGRIVHPEMQFHAIAARAAPIEGYEPNWSGEPKLGVLSRSQSRALVGHLSRSTPVAGACWLCIWDGYGYFTPGAIVTFTASKKGAPQSARRPPRWRLRTPFPRAKGNLPGRERVRLPGRDYMLFRGPVEKAQGWEDGPNLWWPDDKSWCVACEIDFPYTYVGGSKELIDAILEDPTLESLPAKDTDGISYSSDKINS